MDCECIKTSRCIPDGERLGANGMSACCPGLADLPLKEWDPAGAQVRFCTSKCGDGICALPETKLNCQQDCDDTCIKEKCFYDEQFKRCHKEGVLFSRKPLSAGGVDLQPCCYGLKETPAGEMSVCVRKDAED
ncbi:MAG: hypothetical protein HQL20_00105 [Candidatus Omnitrophica bacterium]|nr:hypothetical protein [Candidatus Omnitrophota bacterium]